MGGCGYTNKLETSTNGSTYEVKHKNGLVGGVAIKKFAGCSRIAAEMRKFECRF